ncbi:MAG: tetratricopeptide repeat protein [Phycisphaerae bacterium]
MRQVRKIIATMLVLTAGALPATAEQGRLEGVSVKVEKRTFPVMNKNRRKPHWSPQQAKKLVGKSEYTTEVIVLRNRYLMLEIVPEFGGRIIRCRYTPTEGAEPVELFWQNDKLINACSWSMGGLKWSFPHWEHGRKLSETAGYVIQPAADGKGVTVAMDMRFDRFLTPAETKRYGLATTLRLSQAVTLRAESAAFDWSARVTNPMPIRCGFKLWYLVRPAMKDIHSLVFPATSGVNHGAPKLETWDPDEVVGKRNLVFFAAGLTHPFAGWYYPRPDYNLLVIADRSTLGAKQVLYTGDRYIELWGGNNEVFEEAGRMLPPLAAYELKTRIFPAAGIGKTEYADRHVAIATEKGEGGTRVEMVSPEARDWQLHWSTRNRSGAVKGSSAPRAPLKFFARGEGPVTIEFMDGQKVSKTVQVPVKRPPALTDEEFRALQLRVKGEDRKTGECMPGGKGMLAELTDLTAEHHYSLVRAKGSFRKVLQTSNDRLELLDAARRYMRVSDDFQTILHGLEKVLAKHPVDPHANLYKGMVLLEQGHTEAAEKHLALAADPEGGKASPGLTGAHYLLALRAMAADKPEQALGRLQKVLQPAADAGGKKPSRAEDAIAYRYRGGDDPAEKLQQPGVTLAAERARLLEILCLRKLGRKDQADRKLKILLKMDPALIETHMLAGNREAVETLTRLNPAGRKVARRVLADLEKGTWRGIGRPMEADRK